MSLSPLSEGNRLQRAYARWAAAHYARMPPEAREPAELIDRFLWSRAGLALCAGWVASLSGTVFGLIHAGLDPVAAAAVSTLAWLVVPAAVLGGWLMPSHFATRSLWRVLPRAALLAIAGAVVGGVAVRIHRLGTADPATIAADLWGRAGALLPAAVIGGLTIALLAWGVAQVRRQVLERELERERLARDRDAQARRAAEARLQLLQAQIHPHFVFNTLSALQHWVDQGDARAAPLLRELTAFLRGSTTLLLRDAVPLAEEARLAQHYLAIMGARMGDRLRSGVSIDPALADERLPPGLLLTLVENAVEHGVSPRLEGGSVRVQATRCERGWVLSVCDDGVGLIGEGPFDAGSDPAAAQEVAAAGAPGRPSVRGVGLRNCAERAAHFWQGRAHLRLEPLARGVCAWLEVGDVSTDQDAAPLRPGDPGCAPGAMAAGVTASRGTG